MSAIHALNVEDRPRERHLVAVPKLQTQTRTRLRMTARGRRLLIVLTVVPLIIAIFFAMLSGGTADATNVAVSNEATYVTVSAGQTLYEIADEIAPAADPRDVVYELINYNHIAGEIQPGQMIAIPEHYLR